MGSCSGDHFLRSFVIITAASLQRALYEFAVFKVQVSCEHSFDIII